MARKEGVSIVVIVEDGKLEQFVWRTLKVFGFADHKVRILQDYPKGGFGSGKLHVEATYRKEIVTYRQKARENRALLLGTEADQHTVDDRIRTLDAQISAIGQPPRGPDERIVYWVPKWHVETWGLHLTGGQVDEKTSYKNQAEDIDWREAGKNFVREYRKYREYRESTSEKNPDA